MTIYGLAQRDVYIDPHYSCSSHMHWAKRSVTTASAIDNLSPFDGTSQAEDFCCWAADTPVQHHPVRKAHILHPCQGPGQCRYPIGHRYRDQALRSQIHFKPSGFDTARFPLNGIQHKAGTSTLRPHICVMAAVRGRPLALPETCMPGPSTCVQLPHSFV